MKRIILALGLACCVAFAAGAQSSGTFNSMSFNGATGLLNIPTAKLGWNTDLGIDAGYHMIWPGGYMADVVFRANHIASISMSLFKWAEISASFDFQPEEYWGKDPHDILLNYKVRLPIEKTALAVGGNFQLLNVFNQYTFYAAGQAYIAVTYSGSFFGMPAETTAVLGKTFFLSRIPNNSDIDFGMGFDILLFPDALKNFVHLIVDFANFAYSANPWGQYSDRGILNAGIRINLAASPLFNRFKFTLDITGADLLDANRGLSVGLVFGTALK
jgi:hypothetical protein